MTTKGEVMTLRSVFGELHGNQRHDCNVIHEIGKEVRLVRKSNSLIPEIVEEVD